jgi:flagellar biosynthesis/type III secretory pathway M-ring protein FliF/YscJ
VGNGEVAVSLSLKSPTGVSIGSVQVANVNVRADWEAFGLTALIVLVVAFLVLGVFRTVRRRRRRTAAAPAPAEEQAQDAAPPDEGSSTPPAGETDELESKR